MNFYIIFFVLCEISVSHDFFLFLMTADYQPEGYMLERGRLPSVGDFLREPKSSVRKGK